MQILVTGGTGFIGRSAVAYLTGVGHEVTAYVRDINRAPDQLGKDVRLISHLVADSELKETLENTDCVINLAGEQLAGVRWTRGRKERFVSSRVEVTERIVKQINNCLTPPKLLISASAVGFYDDSYGDPNDENTPKGTGFLRDLCEQWEKSALKAEEAGSRVILMRIGIVLGREGGILKQMGFPFEFGIGNYISKGHQMIPWIHISDVLGIIRFCIENEAVKGPVNLVSPNPCSWKEFSKTLAKILNTHLVIPVPKVFLKLIFGEGAQVLASSQYVLPKVLERFNYKFVHKSLKSALTEEFRPPTTTVHDFSMVNNELWNQNQHNSHTNLPEPTYCLKSKSVANRGKNEVFDFFSSPSNLGLATPQWMDFKILQTEESILKGSEFTYQIKLGPLPLKWKSEIIHWDQGNEFVDLQTKGPYKLWWHHHKLTEQTDGTVLMEDTVLYRIPIGYVGRAVHKLIIQNILKRIFNYRNKIIELRFTQLGL